MPEKAAIYMRVSTDEQNEHDQMEACLKYCQNRGWDAEIFNEHGKSAYKGDKQLVKKQIKEMARKGEIKHIVVWALDRWTRKGGVELLQEVDILASYGVSLHSVQENFLDEISIPGEIGHHVRAFLTGIVGWMAKIESMKRSERVRKSSKFQKAKKESRIGRQPKISEKELKWLQQLKTNNPAMGWRTLAKKLNEERSNPSSELYFPKQHPGTKKIDMVSHVTVKRAVEGEK